MPTAEKIVLSMERAKQGNYQRFTAERFAKQMPNMIKDSILDLQVSEIDRNVRKILENYRVGDIADHLAGISPAHVKNEVENGNGLNLYYQWLACLVRFLKPKQVVELGAASGISTIMIATELSKNAKFYSMDNDPTIAWKWMYTDYPQLTKMLGDDLDMDNWKGIDLTKTDLWFIDTLHTKTQLEKEIELYSPYWKNGTIVVFDDIKMSELRGTWKSLPYIKFEDDKLHYSGFGFVNTKYDLRIPD